MMTQWQPYVVMLLTALTLHVLPRLTRPELFFAVTVAPSFPRSDEGRQIVAGYRFELWLGAAVALGIVTVGGAHLLGLMASQAALLTAALLAFREARRRVLPHAVAPSTVREASLAPRSRRLPGGVVVQLGPFALLAVAAVRGGARMPYARIALAAVTCAMMLAFAVALQRSSRRLTTRGDAGAAEGDFRRLSLVIFVLTEYLVAATVATIAVFGRVRWLPVVQPLAMIGVIVALARLGQGGSRRAAPAAEPDGPVSDRTRDAQWKWGLIYVDREDPALLVEKRFGIGYTLNFGHPWSWALLALIVVVAVGSLLLVGRARP